MPGMAVIAHGVDLVDCNRLQSVLDRHGEGFLKRVFTPHELEYCLGKKRQIEHLAGRFAAKEAVLKVLGTGWAGGVNWTDIEVRRISSGQPSVHLTGRCREIADKLGVRTILVSISHIDTHAIASAIGTDQEPGQGEQAGMNADERG